MVRGFLVDVFFPGGWESFVSLLNGEGVLGSWREMARLWLCFFLVLGEFPVPFEWRGGFWVAGGRWQGARCLVVVFFSGGWESFLFLLNGKGGFG